MTKTKLSDLEVYTREKHRLLDDWSNDHPGLTAVFALTDLVVQEAQAQNLPLSIPNLIYALRELHIDISCVIEALTAGRLEYGNGKRD